LPSQGNTHLVAFGFLELHQLFVMLVVDVLAQVVLTLELLRTEHTPVRCLAPACMHFAQPKHTPRTMNFFFTVRTLLERGFHDADTGGIHMMK
jgi:hypothetical protein